MGILNESQTTPDEESLPLYSNLEFDEANTTLVLPEATATPDEVREFLVRLLVTRRKLPLDHARRTASRWNMGSGRELWMYSPAMYNTIFGSEDGWVIYKDVKLFYYTSQYAKKTFLQRHSPFVLIVAFCSMLVAGLLIFSATIEDPNDRLGIYFLAGLCAVTAATASMTWRLVHRARDPEKTVEWELRTGFFNNSSMLPHQMLHHPGV